MEPTPVQAEIRQLESIRQQAFWWRTGALVALVAVVGGSLAGLNSSVRGLAERGPTQDAFVAQLSEAIHTDIMPTIQTLASQTLTEIQPEIKKEFASLNERVPELTEATMKEIEALQTELPKAAEKPLDDAFRGLLTSREAKIREMYPSVTEEQVHRLVTNLTKAGEAEIREANEELFSSHQAKLASILDHMETIRNSEAANTNGQDPNWEMGLAIFEVVREDLKTLKAPEPKSGKSPKALNAVARN